MAHIVSQVPVSLGEGRSCLYDQLCIQTGVPSFVLDDQKTVALPAPKGFGFWGLEFMV